MLCLKNSEILSCFRGDYITEMPSNLSHFFDFFVNIHDLTCLSLSSVTKGSILWLFSYKSSQIGKVVRKYLLKHTDC